MQNNTYRVFAAIVAFAITTIVSAQNTNLQTHAQRLPITVGSPRGMPESAKHNLNAATRTAGHGGPLNISAESFDGFFAGPTLPFWTFNIKGSRDNDHHLGVMVGHDPFKHPGTDKIPTYIVPLIIRTHRIATAYDPTTGNYTTVAGDTTIDPTQPDNTCLTKPNNVPVKLIQQSPIVKSAPFSFGGTFVGNTQYVDAFQRANFWTVLGDRAEDYHVLLKPVITLAPVIIDVPATAGMALTDPKLFETAYGFTYCAPMLLVDINWFDSYVTGTVIPELADAQVDPATFPILLTYNAAWTIGEVTFIGNCCAIGYHGATGVPIVDQTYGVVDFDTTGWFNGPANGLGTSVMAHEVGEWMNDPFGSNETAPWGGTGQVSSCQANLEVGDPLSGTLVPSVTMSNGYSYSLQELAFFSWFYGAPSTGVNGWFSNNGTFTTDAGPNCPTS